MDAASGVLQGIITAEMVSGVLDEIVGLLNDAQRREAMTDQLRKMIRLDAAERISDMIEELAKR